MQFHRFVLLLLVVVSPLSPVIQAQAKFENRNENPNQSSPFSVALETLQKQIGYEFQSISLLRRAMTHGSYSQENNKALSIFGMNIIDASICLRYLVQNIEISAKNLNGRIADISKVDSSCAAGGLQLGLQKVVRVSRKTNSSTPTVVCDAFRAIFGAIAVDTGKADAAGDIFWTVHGGDVHGARALQ